MRMFWRSASRLSSFGKRRARNADQFFLLVCFGFFNGLLSVQNFLAKDSKIFRKLEARIME